MILRQTFSMNVTPISLAIVRYPIIIEYPNAAHIPFSQIAISWAFTSAIQCQLCGTALETRAQTNNVQRAQNHPEVM